MTATEDKISIGIPKSVAKDIHMQHHYETRTSIRLVIFNSDNRINVKKLEYMVKFHASQIPDEEQYNRICTLFETKRDQYLNDIRARDGKSQVGTDGYEEATCKACIDAEELIQLIMDDDLSIREITTVGTL